MGRRAARRARSIDELRHLARRRLPRIVYDFLDGGAEDETTLRSNVTSFRRHRFVPRVLRGVAERDTSVELFGQRLAVPILYAPIGLTALAHPGGEPAAARAAARGGTTLVASTAASYRIEETAAATSTPPWFQLYPWGDRRVTGELLDRAAASGCRVLCVTVDVPVVGRRERDLRNGFTVPLRVRPRQLVDVLRHPSWFGRLATHRRITFANLLDIEVVPTQRALSLVAYANQLNDPTTDWETIDWIRSRWDGPLLLKGIAHPVDVRRAVEHGVDGVVVSNHGGRQLDRMAASIDLLPGAVAAARGRLTVLLDGGIRRGADVAVALALGADAVLVGRPYLYGLAVGGEDGALHALELLRTELDRVMALVGASCPDELTPDLVASVPAQAWASQPPSTGT